VNRLVITRERALAQRAITLRFGDPSLASIYAFRRIRSPLAAASCAPHHRFLMSRVAAMALAVEILGADLLLLALGDWNSELLEDGRVAERSGRGA
jgi:hypothetical protein